MHLFLHWSLLSSGLPKSLQLLLSTHEEIPLTAAMAWLLLWVLPLPQAGGERGKRETRAQAPQGVVRTRISCLTWREEWGLRCV